MNFKIDSASIQEALRIVARLAPSESGNVTISSTGKKVFLHSSSETNRCSVNMPAEVSGKEGTFALALSALRDATKGRKDLEIEYSKTMCKIKSGSYRAELATVDALEIEEGEEDKGEVLKFTVEQASWLKQAVAAVALKPVALLATFMPLAIKLTDKGAVVCCYDADHMAFSRSKEVTGDMEIKLPLETCVAVLDAFGANPFTLELGRASMSVSNKLVKVVLSLPQEEEGELQIKDVLDMIKSTGKAEGQSLQALKADVLTFLDNSRAVATKERSELKIKVEDQKMRLEVVTVQGTARTSFKTKAKNCEFAIDFEFFDEAVRKAPDQLDIKLVKDEFIAVNLKTSTVVLSLNQ